MTSSGTGESTTLLVTVSSQSEGLSIIHGVHPIVLSLVTLLLGEDFTSEQEGLIRQLLLSLRFSHPTLLTATQPYVEKVGSHDEALCCSSRQWYVRARFPLEESWIAALSYSHAEPCDAMDQLFDKKDVFLQHFLANSALDDDIGALMGASFGVCPSALAGMDTLFAALCGAIVGDSLDVFCAVWQLLCSRANIGSNISVGELKWRPIIAAVSPTDHSSIHANWYLTQLLSCVGHGSVLSDALLRSQPQSPSPLRVALACGNGRAARELLERLPHKLIASWFPSPNSEEDELDFIHLAAQINDADLFSTILSVYRDVGFRHLDLTRVDDDGWAVLHHAAHRGSLQVLALLTSGSTPALEWTGLAFPPTDMQTQCEGMTCLHCGVSAQEVDVVKLLLQVSPSLVDVQDSAGKTGLHHAAAVGNLQISQLLVSAGAQTDIVDKSGQTPLQVAMEMLKLTKIGHDVVAYLALKSSRESILKATEQS